MENSSASQTTSTISETFIPMVTSQEMATIIPPVVTTPPLITSSETLQEPDPSMERGSDRGNFSYPSLEDWGLGGTGPARLYQSTTSGPLLSTRSVGITMPGVTLRRAASQVMPGGQIQTPLSLSSQEDGTEATRQQASTAIPTNVQTAATISTEELMAEMLRRVGQTTNTAPPQPAIQPSNSDLVSRLAATFNTPPPPPPVATPPPSSTDLLLAALAEQLRQQQPPPQPQPTASTNSILSQLLQVLAGGSDALRTASVPVSVVNSKFCDWVARYPLPEKIKIPSAVGTYDGTRDPEDHMALFEQAIMTEKWVDPVACNMFPGTLQGFARDWFADLPDRSIRDFADLKGRFIQNFFQQRKQRRTHLEAHLIRQQEGENINDFVTRYTRECQKIIGLPESQQVSGFILSLLPGALQRKLSRRTPTTFKEAIDIAYDFVRSRETESLTRNLSKAGKAWSTTSNDKHRPPRDNRREYRRDDKSNRRFSPYDKTNIDLGLSKTPREILKTERVGATFRPPPAMQFRTGKKNMEKYCDFHEDNGHDTNACRELKNEIKRAMEDGKLEHLVVGAREYANKPPTKSFGWQKKQAEKIVDPGPPEGHVLFLDNGIYEV